MTKEEILSMEAGGRELDAEVASKILGLEIEERQDFLRFYVRETRTAILNHSTDISAAWQVWQKITDKEPFSWAIYSDYDGIVFVEHYPNDYSGAMKAGSGDFRAWGLCPEAICKAALLAKLGVT